MMLIYRISSTLLRCLALGLLLAFVVQCADDQPDQAEVAEANGNADVVDEEEADAAAMELADSLDFGFGDDTGEEVVEEVLEPRVFVFSDDSKIGFIGSKPTAIHQGTFKNFSGHFTLLGDVIDVDGVHRISIDMSSVATEDEKLTEDLKGENFFNSASFPMARFTLLKMTEAPAGTEGESAAESESGADAEKIYDLVGLLDFLGVKKKITFPASFAVGADRDSVALQAKFSIDRKAFGLDFSGLPDDQIRDRVVIELDLKAAPGDPSALQLTGVENRPQPTVFSAPGNAGDPRTGEKGGGGGQRTGGGRRGGTPGEMIARMDSNGDGKINKDEAPEFIWDRISTADTDGDGAISEGEYTIFRAQREAEGGGFGRGGGGGIGKGGGGKGDDGDR